MSALCVDAPQRIRLSWSRLAAYDKCRQRVRLLNQGKKSPTTDGRNFLPGTLADRCMRRWLEAGRFNPGGMLEFLDEEWERHTGKDSEYVIKWRNNPRADQLSVLEDVKTALEKLEPILQKKVTPFAFKPEFRFTSVVGIPGLNGETVQIEIFGAVDVATHFEQGQYGLYDLKITRRDSYIKSTLAQLIFYDLAFRGHTGVRPVEHAFWCPLLDEIEINLTVTNDDRREMISRIIGYCHNVWAGHWELTEDKNECWNCPTKAACPRFVNPISKDTQGRNRVTFDRADFDLMQVEEAEKSNEVQL